VPNLFEMKGAPRSNVKWEITSEIVTLDGPAVLYKGAEVAWAGNLGSKDCYTKSRCDIRLNKIELEEKM